MNKPQFVALFATLLAIWLAIIALQPPKGDKRESWQAKSGLAVGTAIVWAGIALVRKS